MTCTCCGPDYSLSESETLEDATGYHRNCNYSRETEKYIEEPSRRRFGGPYRTLEAYLAGEGQNVLIIRAEEIADEERKTPLKRQGYVWVEEE